MVKAQTKGKVPDESTPKEPIDKEWDDERVIPKHLSRDTQFLFSRMTEETLKAVGAKKGQIVLDVGCGRALDLAAQGEKGAILVGCDGSRVMVMRAKGVVQSHGLPANIVFCSAENLPFKKGSIDIVYCKGAIDHFYDPRRALEEMERVLAQGGKLVVSVANFESLGCKLARTWNRLHRILTGRELPGPHFWEIPEDHTFKFDRAFLLACLPEGLRVVAERGVSLFWGMKGWGWLVGRLPSAISKVLMGLADRIARPFPALADVIVLTARKPKIMVQHHGPGERGMKFSESSKIQGLAICLGSAVAAILFLVGIAAKSYWALAIPVGIGLFWLLGLVFWIGWTLLTLRTKPPED
jgi:SAM-dependent methyltransferase